MNQTLSPSTLRRRSLRRRARVRGAIFVEATIVICTFTLFLMGVIFFRELYVKKIRTQTLARVSAIAYAMGGCQSSIEPQKWLGDDLGRATPGNKTDDDRTAPESGSNIASSGSDKASSIMSSFPQAGDGSTFLNPVNKITMAKSIKVTKPNGMFRSDSVMETPIGARSHQSCGDVVRDGDFDEIVDVVTGVFNP